jgi:hypothetical protein
MDADIQVKNLRLSAPNPRSSADSSLAYSYGQNENR